MSNNAFSPRKTRSQRRKGVETDETRETEPLIETSVPLKNGHVLKRLPHTLSPGITRLSKTDHKTLLRKRKWLHTYDVVLPKATSEDRNSVDATLVFAQEEAGTAVCISGRGILLTCSHCVAESAEEIDESKSHWLLFSSGRVVETICVAWDARRDLALLRIVAAEDRNDISGDNNALFPSIGLSASSPPVKTKLVCIGQPGSEDLENSLPDIKTNYGTLHVSSGSFCGYVAGQDLHRNSEIGALMHDCWTYWGHSGAPLVEQATGKLVGLHSSWDDETGMRRGIPLEAITDFVKEHSDIIRSLD